MEEALSRRFARAQENDPGFLPLPDLLIMDGGRTQLDVALKVLSDMQLDFVPVIGLAEQNETIYLPDETEPLTLPRNSAALHLVERLRDEAHRFAITYHRGLRQKRALFSVLDAIPGIGDKRKRALFDAFVTMGALKNATVGQLAAVKGVDKRTAEAVYAFFRQEAEDGKAEKSGSE